MTLNVPLSTLRVFEAAARRRSFQAAATELSLSPSAVSHAIRKMEDSLGVVLFERSGRNVRLTPEGEALMGHTERAFEELRRGLELVSTRTPHLLRLHCAPSFAAQWLTPRLARFFAEQPKVEVRLSAGTDYASFDTDEFDADIIYGLPRQEGLVVLPLREETVMPLCAPHIADAVERLSQTLAGDAATDREELGHEVEHRPTELVACRGHRQRADARHDGFPAGCTSTTRSG